MEGAGLRYDIPLRQRKGLGARTVCGGRSSLLFDVENRSAVAPSNDCRPLQARVGIGRGQGVGLAVRGLVRYAAALSSAGSESLSRW